VECDVPVKRDVPAVGFWRQLWRWSVGSALAFGVNIGTAALLHEVIGTTESLAVGISFTLVYVINFFLQRYYIFDSRGCDPWRQVAQFLITSGLFRVAEYGLFLAFHQWLAMQYLLAVVVVSSIGFVSKFLIYRVFIFGPAKPDALEV